MALTFVQRSYQGHVNHCVTFDLHISENIGDRGLGVTWRHRSRDPQM